MRITESQQRILESLCCERLSSNEDNFQLVDDFIIEEIQALYKLCKMKHLKMIFSIALLIMW